MNDTQVNQSEAMRFFEIRFDGALDIARGERMQVEYVRYLDPDGIGFFHEVRKGYCGRNRCVVAVAVRRRSRRLAAVRR